MNTVLIRILLQICAVKDTSCTEDADDCRSVVVNLDRVVEFLLFASVVGLRPILSHCCLWNVLFPAELHDLVRFRLCGPSSPHTYSGQYTWTPHLNTEVEQARGFALCAFGNILLNITLPRKPSVILWHVTPNKTLIHRLLGRYQRFKKVFHAIRVDDFTV